GAAVTPKTGVTATGRAVALDLSANTTGVLVQQTKATATSAPSITGDVRLGSGDDRIELLGGTLTGNMSFGNGADTLIIDAAGVATGRITDTDGRLTLDVREGRLAVSNTDAVQLSALSVGAKGVLAVTIDGAANTATRFNVSGAATLASGAQFDLNLASLVRGSKSYEIVRAGTLQAGAIGANLVGAPYLYSAGLRTDTANNAIIVDVRPKTASELGLNRSGTQAYAAVFDSLDRSDAIEAAFLAQKTQAGFDALYDQMLPDHSGGALMSAQAISQAISQAAAQPVSRSTIGGMGVWAQEILFHIDRDREDAMGFKSNGFGLAAGLELIGQANAVGLSASFVTTDYKDKDAATGERVAMNYFEGGAYWRMQAGALSADARGGIGYVSFDSERKFSGAGVNLTSDADWSGWLVDAHAGAAYHVEAGWLYARPEVSVDYLRLSEGDYQESGGGVGFDLDVDKRKGDLLTAQGLVAIGARFGQDVYWSPEVKVGYRAKLAGDPGRTTARFAAGGGSFTLDPEDAYSGGFIGRVGVKGGTDAVLYSIEGGGVFDDGYREYDLRAVIKFQF
ncbi:MAG: autotransporter domain-containing protein, partial [Phenylobacterium sp.]